MAIGRAAQWSQAGLLACALAAQVPVIAVGDDGGLTAAEPPGSGGAKPEVVSFARPVLLGALKGYQRLATARNGICPMWPSCSRFADEAFSTHPALTAFFLTADRLHRCGHDMRRYRPSPDNPFKLHDPVPKRSVSPHVHLVDLGEELWTLRTVLARHDDSGWAANTPISDTSSSTHEPTQADAPPPADDARAAARQFRFANELRASSEFDKAIVEYQRFLSFYPESPDRGRAMLALLGAYRQNGQYEEAARYGRTLIEGPPDADVASDDLKLTVGYDWMMLGNGRLARTYFDQVKASTDVESRRRAQLLDGLSFVRDGRWREAEQAFLRGLPPDTDWNAPFASRARALAKLADEGHRLPRRNPALAGLLGIVPGLGYLYSGYPGTGLSSALINGLFMAATYKAFKAGNEALGVTLGVLSLGWYGGNITGSISTARRRNEALTDAHILKFSIGFRY